MVNSWSNIILVEKPGNMVCFDSEVDQHLVSLALFLPSPCTASFQALSVNAFR